STLPATQGGRSGVLSAAAGPLATAAQPAVVTRAAWGARNQACAPDVASGLVAAVVHHTATTNGYASVDAAKAQIRNIQAYHIDGRGWCDIGYNFLVDKWGNIYEGRANGMTQPVVGVHAGGFNTGTVGVSMLGDYTATTPSAATQDAVGRIIGWRLGAYGVDPRGTMSYYTGNGDNSRFKNQWVTLPRVFGHRDT
ncbi:peptidoglycan recognition protein, partial [Cellulomonas sp.]|uniref:peptidoglycan recognition protein family protein n=1 Tax=Cellulomonas sp. TaxID=40001 RepID=UPI001B2B8DB1